MSTKNKPAKPSPAPSIGNPGEVEDPEVSPAAKRDEQEMERLLAVLQDQRMTAGMMVLHRRAVNEAAHSYLDQMAPSDFTLENVKSIYGGGDYKVQARTGGGTIAGSYSFKIDPRIPAKHPNGKPAEESASDASKMVRELKSLFEPLIAKATAPAPAAPVQDNSVLLKIMETQAQQAQADRKQSSDLLIAVLTRQAPAAPATDPALVAVLAKLADSLGERRSSPNPLAQLRELKQVMDEFRDDEGTAKEPSMVESIVKGAASALGPMFAQMAGGGMGGMGQPSGLPALPAPAGSGQRPPPQARPVSSEPRNVTPVRQVNPAPPAAPAASAPPVSSTPPETPPPVNPYIAQLQERVKSAIADEIEPDDFVDSLFNLVPRMFHNQVFALAVSETWHADLFSKIPELDAHREWLDNMRGFVLERMFVDYCKAAQKAGSSAVETLAAFLQSTRPDVQEIVANLSDAEEIEAVFSRSKIPDVWVEELRAGIEKLVSMLPKEDAAPVEVMTPPAPPAVAPKVTRPKAKAKPGGA